MLKKITLIAGLLSLVSPCFAAPLFSGWGFKPNAGVDLNFRHQGFESGFGEEHFSENSPAANFYVGNRFNNFLGVEVGYERSFAQENQEFYSGNRQALGFARNLSLQPEKTFLSEQYLKGWHADLLGHYPICPKLKTELVGLVGVAFQKMVLNTVPIYDGTPATPVESWSSNRRSVARAGLGLNQMITNNFGLRVLAVWEDTSRLGTTVPVLVGQGGAVNPTRSTNFYTVKPKDSYVVGAGFFFSALDKGLIAFHAKKDSSDWITFSS